MKCQNTLENEAERQEAIKATLERNPGAFEPKIGATPQVLSSNFILWLQLSLEMGHHMHLNGINCCYKLCLAFKLKKESVKR